MRKKQSGLYLIEFLHQTTTAADKIQDIYRCILLNFYIKPQLLTHAFFFENGCILLNFYIKPQLKKVKCSSNNVVSYWISTSNHNLKVTVKIGKVLYLIEFLHQTTTCLCYLYLIPKLYLIEFLHQTTTLYSTIYATCGCILLNFYIKPQQVNSPFASNVGCILLNFYIKPQLSDNYIIIGGVVSYWISTSNHNHTVRASRWTVLYLIEFLHQTTTILKYAKFQPQLYLIEFLHQTTTWKSSNRLSNRCILLNFYIKPQLIWWRCARDVSCILLNFYIKPQLMEWLKFKPLCCILLNFYIKPQPYVFS